MKNVRKLIALGSIMLVASSAAISRAETKQSYTLSPFAGYYLYDDKDKLEDGPVFGLGLGHDLTKEWAIELAGFYVDSENAKPLKNGAHSILMRLEGLYNFSFSEKIIPFLAAGAGSIYMDAAQRKKDYDPFVNYGGGVKYQLDDDLALRIDVQHIIPFEDTRNNFLFTIGASYRFGGVKDALDNDDDGVPDLLDSCADTPRSATVDSKGCPLDSDGDGVYDHQDRCPNTESGLSVDKKGCPLDSDGDGVYDQLDKCSDTPRGVKVDAKGCPLDSDGDGVEDYLDKCPGTKSDTTVDQKGCPLDSDKDGVIDKDDQCPATESGVRVNTKGCPLDSDNDGVSDSLDKCPDTPMGEHVDENGCTQKAADADNDGVRDATDRCPGTESGVKVDKNGCPFDNDTDGVYDYQDKCANTPQGFKVDANGCPLDTDGDGVYDSADRCPNSPWGIKVEANGCPFDSDADGIYDYLDKCADTPEGIKIDANGCPLDTDKDGVYDSVDKCPDTPKGAKIDDQGCNIKLLQPVSLKINVEFDVNKAEIKPEYHDNLAEVATFMRSFPDSSAVIEGHTDSSGNPDMNKELSQRRADSVVNYLINKLEIQADRLKAEGFGASNPVTSNDTAEGRAQNRRVVATISGTTLVDKK
ncbi:MAG: hypothetical protein A2511_11195 [Deltaproteobacteria bacterium RIFOXYD12_FULL_50_9]|nr:MAG: hypothetical protein A2511_11195 [Deltaproteobacteria bacterium RIFOXYD12_FULL_50_9]